MTERPARWQASRRAQPHRTPRGSRTRQSHQRALSRSAGGCRGGGASVSHQRGSYMKRGIRGPIARPHRSHVRAVHRQHEGTSLPRESSLRSQRPTLTGSCSPCHRVVQQTAIIDSGLFKRARHDPTTRGAATTTELRDPTNLPSGSGCHESDRLACCKASLTVQL